MNRNIFIPLVTLVMMAYAVLHVERGSPSTGPAVAASPGPFENTFADFIAASGIVEAQTENIAVGSSVAGIVTRVEVRAGREVEAGDPLFRLDDRELVAELRCQEANLNAARAQLARLENQPRPEELPGLEAAVREAEAILQHERDRLVRERRLSAVRATPAEILFGQEQEFRVARERLARAAADLQLRKAGAWTYDKEVAQSAVTQAESQVDRVKTQLERLTVRSPIAGDILQVDVRPGEFVGTPPGRPLVLLGDVHRLHVRVSIDEHESPRFRVSAPAIARLKGLSRDEFPLTFVRVEPFVVPKMSLTGSGAEKTDTRVLQVIYAIAPSRRPLYVGQQMDVQIRDDSCL